MIINMTGGGGGAALNFKVVPGLTQPEAASENTIWVKTEQINSWYFSATQPEWMQEWDVWFPTGTGSDVEFNALRKNGLQVYLRSAKQIVSGALVNPNAMIYQNSKWNDIESFIYKDGSLKIITGFTGVNGSVSTDGKLRFESSTSSCGLWWSNEKIDVTNVKEIHVTFTENAQSWSVTQYGDTPSVGVSKNTPTVNNSTFVISGWSAITRFVPKTETRWEYIPDGTYTLDVSSVSGFVYLFLSTAGTSGSGGMLDIKEIELVY